MKRLLSFSLVLVFLHMFSYSYCQTFQWAFGIGGGPTGDLGKSLTADHSGNVYTACEYGIHRMAIYKNDSAGNLIWLKTIDGFFDFNPGTPAIDCDPNGNLYLTGSFANTIDFDPGPAVFNLISNNGPKSYILKLDSAGNFNWAKMWTSNGGGSRATSIDYNNNGYFVTAGFYTGIMDLDPGPGISYSNNTVPGQDDAYTVKLDTSGNFIWGIDFGGPGLNYANDITTDASDNVIISGYFQDSVDFDPGPGVYYTISQPSTNTFILKVDANGNFDWASCTSAMGNSSAAADFGVTVDSFGNVYSTGYFIDSCDFDPGPGINLQVPNSGYNCFIWKLNATGTLAWVKTYESSVSNSITYCSQGVILTTGHYADTVDFDPGPGIFQLIATGFSDFYLLSLNTNGDFINVKSSAGVGFAEGKDVVTDYMNNIYVTGYFNDTIDFNPPFQNNLVSSGGNDIFTLKYGPVSVGLDEINSENAITVYPNPTDGQFSIRFDNSQSGNYILYNLLGEKIQEATFVNSNFLQYDIECPPGVYLLSIQTGDSRFNSKIIKY